MAAFPERLRQLREERCMSQRELSAAIHTNHCTIYMFESEKSQPRADTILELCRYFDVSADYLLGLSDVRHAEADAIAPRLEQVYAALFDIRKLAQDAITTVKEA
ncbi:MAG: helix-turn-helix transcriptional regulator [Clostridia bacterium]|nr:helix-turn-helix transcriptional regulator [Clostridia bacterium]